MLKTRPLRARSVPPVQVAAVCYRRKRGALQFLLVRTSSGRWTFPKGRNEAHLSYAEIAALEAFEEGGVEGRVLPRSIGAYLHRKESLRGYASKDVTVLAFLLHVHHTAMPVESKRRPRWVTADEARPLLAKRRPGKYGRSIERVFDSALRAINHQQYQE